MAFQHDDLTVSHQLVVGDGFPISALKTGKQKIRGSAYVEGPTITGDDSSFSNVDATVMIGPTRNQDVASPDRSLFVKGDAKVEGNRRASHALLVDGDTRINADNRTSNALLVNGDEQIINGDLKLSNLRNCTGQGCNFTSSTINIQSWKGFDIQHPKKEGHRLRYVCLEGPEGGVYIRGRVKNETEIVLPDYWENLVDIESITVSLTPIGAHQDIIVKGWDKEKIYLQSKNPIPINCFYHVFAERKDGEKLIVEYEGESPKDYPGNSSQYSIAGYDY